MAAVKKKRSALSLRAAEIRNEIQDTLKLNDGVISLGNDPYFTITRVPTGSLVMDRITGGGFAHGRHYELFGDESSGKSYIVYMTMVLSQLRGNLCAMIDPEHSFDEERFVFLGGNPEELLLEHPENAEQAVATMMLLARNAIRRRGNWNRLCFVAGCAGGNGERPTGRGSHGIAGSHDEPCAPQNYNRE